MVVFLSRKLIITFIHRPLQVFSLLIYYFFYATTGYTLTLRKKRRILDGTSAAVIHGPSFANNFGTHLW